METLEQLRDRLLARFPGAEVTLVPNYGAAAQHSLTRQLPPPARRQPHAPASAGDGCSA
jgi:hypothetical protein